MLFHMHDSVELTDLYTEAKFEDTIHTVFISVVGTLIMFGILVTYDSLLG